MTEQSMVGKVARALAVEDGDWGDWSKGEIHPRFYRRALRAIEAMREPTAAMTNRGEQEPTKFLGAEPSWDVREIWQAMISEALK